MSDTLTTLELAALILAAEFFLAAVIGPALLLRRARRQAASAAAVVVTEQRDAEALFEAVEQKEPSRRDALATIIGSTYAIDGAELDGLVEQFIAREQAFYRVMTSVYLERDSSRLKELPEELTKLVSPWLRLTPRDVVPAAAVADLEQQNTVLSAELERTQASMNELLEEYMRAFQRSQAGAMAPAVVATVAAAMATDDSTATAPVPPRADPAAAAAVPVEDDTFDFAAADDAAAFDAVAEPAATATTPMSAAGEVNVIDVSLDTAVFEPGALDAASAGDGDDVVSLDGDDGAGPLSQDELDKLFGDLDAGMEEAAA